MRRKIRVYSLLTLDRAEIARRLPEAEAAAPIARGDLLRAVDEKVNVAVIIDGAFDQSNAVSPNEILDALRCGMRVYGCSSMGALRAVELHLHGMLGNGAVYERILTSNAFRDDHLAQAFSRTGREIRPLSQAFVDFEFNLERLVRMKSLSRQDAVRLARLQAGLFYPARHPAGITQALESRGLERLVKVARIAAGTRWSQKRQDAIDTLRRVRRDLRGIDRLNRAFQVRAGVKRL